MMKKIILFCFVVMFLEVSAQGYITSAGEAVWVSSYVLENGVRSEDFNPDGLITNAGEVFSMESDFPANPLNNTANYKFDYKINQEVSGPEFTGQLNYYVNSKDGSIAFAIEENPTLLEKLSSLYAKGKGKAHFLIRKADGNLLLCGTYKNPRTGVMEKRGMDIGKNKSVAVLFGEQTWDNMYWFNRAETSSGGSSGNIPAGAVAIIENAPVTKYSGSLPNGGSLDMYMINFPTMIPISTQYMGFGTGVIKNLKKRVNSLVILSIYNNIPTESGPKRYTNYMQSMFRVDATFRPGDYTVTTAMNKSGTADINNFMQRMQQVQQQVIRLQNQRADCEHGSEGRACRERIDAQIKALNEQLKQEAEQLKDIHKIPGID